MAADAFRARRDRHTAWHQAKLEERSHPGLCLALTDRMQLLEEFCRRDGNWAMVCEELNKE